MNRSFHRVALASLAAAAVAAVSLPTSGAVGTRAALASINHAAVRFPLVRSAGAVKVSCLPNARGVVRVIPGSLNDLMEVVVAGLPPQTDFDLFVTQLPSAPFGVAWYQSDLHTDDEGHGYVQVRGIFDVETFSVSPGGSTTFGATHQYHLGLWFNDPRVPFNLGCEPNGPGAKPVVTPFNGEQHAGIQVVNTSNFPDAAGPLSHVTR